MNFKNLFNTEDDSDMIDMSNPDNHPDWAKEVHSKYGIGANRSPSSLPQYVHPEDIKSGEDMSSVYKSVFGNRPLKNMGEQEESPEIERVKDTIKSYQEQGIKDSVQLLPLYNKLVELREAKKASKVESTPAVSNSVSEGTPTNKYKSLSGEQGLFSADEIGEMAAVPKRKKNLPMENEINAVESEIRALTSQGINDSSKLVPLYNKLGGLKTVQKSLLDVEQQKLDAENRKKFPAFYGEEPAKAEVPAIAAKPEAPLKSLSSKPRAQQSVTEEPLPSSTEQSASSADFDLDSYLKPGKVSSSMDEDPLSFLKSGLTAPATESKPAFDLDSYLKPSANSSPTAQDPLAFLNEVRAGKSPVSPSASAPSAPSGSAKSVPSSKAAIGAAAGASALEEPSNAPVEAQPEMMTEGQRLANMQSQAAKLRLIDTMTKGAEKLGAGISGAMSGYVVKPGQTDTFENLAKQIEENFKQQKDFESEDPDSEYSKGFRAFAQPLVKQLGLDPNIIKRMSGKQLGAVIPELRQMYENKLTNEYRKEAAAASRADRALKQQELNLYKDKALQLRSETAANRRFDTNTKDEVNRIQGADRALHVIDKIRSGELKGAQNIREQLNAEVSQLLLPAGMRPSVAGLTRTQIDTYYGRVKDLIGKIKGGPTDTITEPYINQIEKEVRLLQDAYRGALKQKVSSMQKGTKDEFTKQMFQERASEYLPEESSNSDEEAINWAKQNPKDPRAAEILKLHGL